MRNLVDEQTTSPSFPLLSEREAVLGKEEGDPSGVGGCLKKEKIKFIEYNRAFIEYARRNRKNSTKVEETFWHCVVKNRKLLGYKFRRQKVIGPFILDFYCSKVRLGIELDGGYHNNRTEYDIMRDSEIYKKGILVIRFTNEDIKNNLPGVIEELKEFIRQREKSILDSKSS